MKYQLGEVVPISVYRTNNAGSPQTGLSTRCSVFSNLSGATALSPTPMPEVATGFYATSFTPSSTGDYTAVIFNGTGSTGSILDSFRFRVVQTVEEIKNTIDLADGKIV